MDGVFKKVCKWQYYKFIDNYGCKLYWDVTGICEPPLGSHNDFSGDKKWPESMVGKIEMYDGSEYHSGRTHEYYIKIK